MVRIGVNCPFLQQNTLAWMSSCIVRYFVGQSSQSATYRHKLRLVVSGVDGVLGVAWSREKLTSVHRKRRKTEGEVGIEGISAVLPLHYTAGARRVLCCVLLSVFRCNFSKKYCNRYGADRRQDVRLAMAR